MKRLNYYLTLSLVLYTTVFSFFNMFKIVSLSRDIILIVFNNLLPSLLPFMILISLCLSLGLIHLLNYIIQWILCPLFHLTPIMSSLYFISFFCGYPTNVKMIKESYELNYISLSELQHLLSISSFSSLSFIFISLNLDYQHSLLIYIAHILPSIIRACFYKNKYHYQNIQQTLISMNKPNTSFINCFKKSITSSLYAFVFILGYMLVFQFFSCSLNYFIHDPFLLSILQGILEFSSGCIQLLQYDHFLVYPLISFFLSFSSFSVFMQVDNLLENIPYSFKRYFKDRMIHATVSFLIVFFYQLLTL